MVRLERVSKSFGPLQVLRDIDIEVKTGEVVVLIGASGSGKTTLLRCINCLEHIDRGRIYVDGVPMGVHDESGTFKPDPEAPPTEAGPDRHGFPALQPLRPHDRAPERHPRPDDGEEATSRRRRAP
jgi:energy-coupling factor transporter ATP-binding protein EcfA2